MFPSPIFQTQAYYGLSHSRDFWSQYFRYKLRGLCNRISQGCHYLSNVFDGFQEDSNVLVQLRGVVLVFRCVVRDFLSTLQNAEKTTHINP